MTPEEEFRRDLRKSIVGADSAKIDRSELLEDVFKTYTAKLFEHVLGRKKEGAMEMDALVEVKRNLISEFMNTELGEYQKPLEWYEDLFDETVKEIFNDAGLAHKGEDQVSANQTLEINPAGYAKEGGLYVPDHMKGI
jgi:hypothetical protein